MQEPPLLADLRGMDPYTFEKFVADVWGETGYTTEVSQASNDMGVDVVAHGDEKVVIQAKRYSASNKVGGPKVQQYASLERQENADRVCIVTTGYFTDQAKEIAQKLNVELVNGVQLCQHIADLPAGEEITQHYFGTSAPSQRRWGSSYAGESPIVRWVVGLLGAVYLFGGIIAIARGLGIALPQPLQAPLQVMPPDSAPGLGFIFLSTGAMALILLKWATLWRWKFGGVFIMASWFGAMMADVAESVQPWVMGTTLLLAILSPPGIAAMYSFAAHRRVIRLGKRCIAWGREFVRDWGDETGTSEPASEEKQRS